MVNKVSLDGRVGRIIDWIGSRVMVKWEDGQPASWHYLSDLKIIEEMPCAMPNCMHLNERSNFAYCKGCGTRLRKFVPIFKAMAEPYGWRWEVVK